MYVLILLTIPSFILLMVHSLLVDPLERNTKTRTAYLDLMRGVAETDRAERDRRMEHVRDDLDRFRAEAKDSDEVKSFASTRVRGAIKQFTELVRHSLLIILYAH